MSRRKKPLQVVFVYGVLAVIMTVSTARAENSNGYSGLMAPKKDPVTQQKEQPLGYGGLIPGRTQSTASTGKTGDAPQKEVKKTVTAIPHDGKSYPLTMKPVDLDKPKPEGTNIDLKTITSADDIRFASAIFAADDNLKVPDIKLPEHVLKTLARPQSKSKDGLTMGERMTKFKIEQLFSLVKKEGISEDERRKQADEIEKKLTDMQEASYSRKATPIEIYKKLGLPDTYVQEKKVALESSLKMIEAALEEIKKYK